MKNYVTWVEKFVFQLKGKYVCEMVEENLEIKDCEYDIGSQSYYWKNMLNRNKDQTYNYIHVKGVQI